MPGGVVVSVIALPIGRGVLRLSPYEAVAYPRRVGRDPLKAKLRRV